MKHLFPFLILYIIGGSLNAKTISGVIIDSKSKENVGLVRVGINACCFTLSDEFGHFTLNIPSERKYGDTTMIVFDKPGYATFYLSLKDLRASGGVVSMKSIQGLKLDNPISVNGKVRREGITSGSSTFIFMLDEMKELGGEFGIIIGENAPCVVSSLNLYIGNSKIRHLKFRVNIYDVHNGYKRINEHEIITSADLGSAYLAQDGWVKFDISNYNLIIDREVLIVFENIYLPNISKDIELSCPGLSAIIGKSNFYIRLSPFDDFQRVDIKVSMYAEVTPVTR